MASRLGENRTPGIESNFLMQGLFENSGTFRLF
jgi:hypothetical protein